MDADDSEETLMARTKARSTGLTAVAAVLGLLFPVPMSVGCASQSAGAAAHSSGSGSTPEAAPLPPIVVQRTGGFAGRKDTVTVDPTGAWSATDRGGTQKAGSLTPAQLTTIRALATDPRLPAEAGQRRPPTRCRDAFAYQLTVGGTHIEYVDCPADADQPTASIALVKALVGYTISAPSQ